MKKYFFFLVTAISFSVAAQQNDPVIMTINGNDVRKSEFEYIYNKNNGEESIEQQSLEDYTELFKNFKLKVMEAEAQGLDTLPDFIRELSEYRIQLAQPYLDSLETNAHLAKKEYERMKSLVEISHILFPFPGVPDNNFKILPADTLETYKKAVQIYNRIRKGESYDAMVQEYSLDEQTKKQGGYLGWFGGLQLNLPLEDVAYGLKAGQCGIARSNYGYHILKLLGKRENPGQIRASHILITVPEDAGEAQIAAAQNTIDSIYNALLNGADFAALAGETSGDRGSAAKGGDLGFFEYGRMVQEFRDNVFAMETIGDITKPFKTSFGFHIAKLTGKKPLESFEEKKSGIESLLKKGGYAVDLFAPGIDRLKKEFGFSGNNNIYRKLVVSAVTMYPTDSLFEAVYANSPDILFKAGDISYTVADFIKFLKKDPHSPCKVSTELVAERLKAYEYSVLLKILDKDLENRYPEFADLVREFRDGSLMFEVSKREVWDKASSDSDGLQKFFEANKQQYAWDEPHYKGYVILAKDAATKKKMLKEISKRKLKEAPEEAVAYLEENYKIGDVAYVKIEKVLSGQGENPFVDEWVFKTGKAEKPEGFGDFFLMGKVLNSPELYTDVRGTVITDYQDHLEKEWIKTLNEKYPVTIYKDVLIP
ncbi:MAG: peptidylprolyl isomerase [Dysgonamonadaceae bacterium]|jgi:peptidyl-prolyl cis-trans isomerase SurA|nr:peptidylprolyl isomerase [Dysgonamonadaceae bacterium]